MNSSWRSFIVVELILLVFAAWQIIHNPPLLILFGFGTMLAIYAGRKKHRSGFSNFLLVVGVISIIISILNSLAVWIMIVFAILFIGLRGVEMFGMVASKAPWNKKQMILVETTNKEPKNGRRFKRAWFGNERIGSNVYEWDDINIDILAGDTIVDLGNTLLPKDDNVIIVRKGFGRTRILVPLGVAVLLEHSTFYGNVHFEEEKYQLRNESVKFYSTDYDTNTRRLKIITNTLLGDVEVIRV